MDRSQSLLQLAAKFSDHLCTDPRDKIYALLGITDPFLGPNPLVDYAKSKLEVFFDMLLPTLATTTFSENMTFSNQDDYSRYSMSSDSFIKLQRGASTILNGLSISSSGLDPDFLAGSVRIPIHSLASLRRVVVSRFERLSILARKDDFVPSDGNTSIEPSDLVLSLGPLYSIVVRVEPSNKQYKIIGFLDESEDYECFARTAFSRRAAYGRFETELCEVLDRTIDGDIRCIYVHLSRAAMLPKIEEYLDREQGLLLLGRPAVTNHRWSRICTCRSSNLDTTKEAHDYHPVLGRLAQRIRERQKPQSRALEPFNQPIPAIDLRYIGSTRRIIP